MGDIKKTIEAYRKHRLEKLSEKTDFNYIELNSNQEKQILQSILNMPVDRQNLLIFKNYYEHTFDEIGDIFNIENPKGEYLHLLGILTESLTIEKALISDKSMKKVCEKAAKVINEKINKELEMMNNKNNKILIFNTLVSKKIASIILIVLISSGLFVGVNAYADGILFEWMVSTFQKYTSFSISDENKLNKENVDIKFEYIPKGFELVDSYLLDDSDTYYYNNQDKVLYILVIYDSISSGMNTENVKTYEFKIEDNKVITWEIETETYFVFSKNGIGYQIYGNIDREDFIKIYDGISLKRK